MLLLSSSSVSASDYDPGIISACASEVSSASLSLWESSVTRAVVRASTVFAFSSVSIADNFVGGFIGSAAANAEADALKYTLRTLQAVSRTKVYTPYCAHPDILRTVVHAFSRDCFNK